MVFYADAGPECSRFIWRASWLRPKGSAAQEFLRAAAIKSVDLGHRQTIRRAIDHYEAAVEHTRGRFNDWEAARQRCHEIKWEALNHLGRYLVEFEGRVRA